MDLFRAPWEEDFPDTILHTNLRTRDTHPDYEAAKSGDPLAAARLAVDLINPKALDHLRHLIGEKKPLLTAVSAIETTGFNAIPDAMASVIEKYIGKDLVEIEKGEIRQINKVAHTRAKGFWRFVTPALFTGQVIPGRSYILVDDHIGHGGTLANMRGYINHHGGQVIGMTTLTETRDAKKIKLEPTTLDMLRLKHGQDLEHLWLSTFGYGLDCLTNVEGGYLARQPDVDSIRRFMAAAAEEARAAGLRPLYRDENDSKIITD